MNRHTHIMAEQRYMFGNSKSAKLSYLTRVGGAMGGDPAQSRAGWNKVVNNFGYGITRPL
jgi:hypothetical protein